MNNEQVQSAQRLNSHLFNGRSDLGFVGFGNTEPNQANQHFIVYCYGKWRGEVLTDWEGIKVVYKEGLSKIVAQAL